MCDFHDDWTINVDSPVLTRKNATPPWQPYGTINVASREKCPPLGSHVFQANVTILELIQDIIETNLQTKFPEDWSINVASREFRLLNSVYRRSAISGAKLFARICPTRANIA
ncbi:hypothetical protein DPMN_073669 [Dreissena polymorpha]|uniref:Uncharacterized protein n=1 Tax=Dreissena polymorpha TaxID=45954 RepID=A0A9D4BZI6_DREPO|nr:hypothetical protein DPMN_073669 [Dreissena polymorpha]